MKYLFCLALLLFGLQPAVSAQAATDSSRHFVLVIHGGAGALGDMSESQQAVYKEGMARALKAGYDVLKGGGTAVDAVTRAIMVLEDDSLFNAGKGAVFSYEGRNELDASIMDGSNLKAGAVAGVTIIKNPITAARAVMEQSPHVMMAREGAERFAAEHGCTTVKPAYFYTQRRWEDLQRAKKKMAEPKKTGMLQPENPDWKYGTVGAVALDLHGNLAAGTSTGGMTAKRWGRIGDSPIIGAGTYADNATCAVSCTGWGEYFIRLGMAKTISDRMEYGNEPLQTAAPHMIYEKLAGMGGDGGLIALDRQGNFAMPYNTEGMFRGYVKEDGQVWTGVYGK